MTLAADLLHALFNQYYLDRLAYHPMEATMSGIVGYNDRYENDISLEYRKNQREMYIRYLKALDGFDREAFPENDIISYDVLKWICTVSLEQLQFPLHLLPVNQFFSPHLIIGQYATGNGAQPFKGLLKRSLNG